MPAEQSLRNIFYIGTRYRELGGFIMGSLKYPGVLGMDLKRILLREVGEWVWDMGSLSNRV